MSKNTSMEKCSFCGREKKEVNLLIAGIITVVTMATPPIHNMTVMTCITLASVNFSIYYELIYHVDSSASPSNKSSAILKKAAI